MSTTVALPGHGRPALRQQRRIAQELQRIAETLLGMQQDRFILERNLAQPQRRRELPLGIEQPGLPAAFVLLPTFRVASLDSSSMLKLYRARAKSGASASARR